MDETKSTVAKAKTVDQKKIEALEKELKEKGLQLEQSEMKLMSVDRASAVQESNEMQAVVENLQRKLEEIEKTQHVQTFITTDGKKPKYRTVKPGDVQKDSVTFTARCVSKLIPSFMDENGVEVIAPFKIIHLRYAASDIRQDGPEQSILNFCTYTTKLAPEIEFLRAHPEHGVTFGESMNEVAGHDGKDYQFKVRAGQEVSGMSSESVIQYADSLNIPNRQRLSVKRLKEYIVNHLFELYKSEAGKLQDELKNRIMEQTKKANL